MHVGDILRINSVTQYTDCFPTIRTLRNNSVAPTMDRLCVLFAVARTPTPRLLSADDNRIDPHDRASSAERATRNENI